MIRNKNRIAVKSGGYVTGGKMAMVYCGRREGSELREREKLVDRLEMEP